MAELSSWAEAIGPLYNSVGLERRGIEEVSELISITTTDRVVLYPQNQFDLQIDPELESGERLVPREKVLELWGTILRPAIQAGIVHEYTFVAHLFHVDPPKLSMADQIAANPDNFDYVSTKFIRLINLWSK